MKKFLLLILLGGYLINAGAQPGHLKFDHLGVREGLPEARIFFIKQDSRGYIWMGTQNGLLRYDGYKPKVYHIGTGSYRSFMSMIEDNNKTLWFCTLGNGLFKYNRANDSFTQYQYPEKQGKPEMTQGSFEVVDVNNNLWCFSQSAINSNYVEAARFNPKTGAYHFYNKYQKGANYLNAATINTIYKAHDGSVWLAANTGLFKYDYKGDHFNAYASIDTTGIGKNINFIYEAPSEPGILWINAVDFTIPKAVIEQIDTRTNTVKSFYPDRYPTLNKFNNIVNSAFEDKDHLLWFATAFGMLSLDRKTATFTRYLPTDTAKEKSEILGIVPAKNNSLWLSCSKGMLNFDLATHQFQSYSANPGDPSAISGNQMVFDFDATSKLLVDNSDILWAAFGAHGADRVNPLTSAFITYKNSPSDLSSFPGHNIPTIISSPEGYTLFVNENGIYKWLPGANGFKKIYEGAKSNLIGSLALGPNGVIYFSDARGFNVFNSKLNVLKTYSNIRNDPASVSSNEIDFIQPDRTGKVWISTAGKGICVFDPAAGNFKRYPFIENNGFTNSGGKLDDASVSALYEDREGTIWVGTVFGGLNRFDPHTGTFKSYLFDGHSRVNFVKNIYEDSKSRLWVCTYLDGVFEFDRKTERYTRHINENNGLLFNSSDGICEDKNGFLWVSSLRGLSRINPVDLSVITFPIAAILPGNGIIPSGSSLLRANDHIILATKNSVTLFNPDDLSANPYPPLVNIEKVSYSSPKSADSAASQTIDGLKTISLAWNQNKISFSYVGLHFANPQQNKYAYFLDGYDKGWVPAGTQRNVTYTNLAPGAYTFRVKAANSDNVWNKQGASVTIIIHPPWWLTWWAWGLYIMLFFGAVYIYIGIHSRNLRRENLLLEEMVQVRTKQLGEANKGLHEKQEEITAQRDDLETQKNNLENTLGELRSTQAQLVQSEKMASLVELTAGIAHEIQNPLNFVNNFSEVSMELVTEMEEELDKGDVGEAKAIAADVKQNLGKIQHHGKRAEGIVKGMLQHSRTGSGQKEPTDLNALADDFLKLACRGARGRDKNFTAEMLTSFDPSLPKISVVPQDIGRLLLNLFNNAFYAINEKVKTAGAGYLPTVEVSTRLITHEQTGKGNEVLIVVKDNGTGIPENIIDKIMQPFFTTKPTGEGIGLGLSMSYDIVKAHSGVIEIKSRVGEYSEFCISIPV